MLLSLIHFTLKKKNDIHLEKQTLFLVNSPIEMISAIEAREHFAINHCKLLLYISETDRKVIEYLLKKSENWNDVQWISRKSYYGLSWILLIKKLKKVSYNYFFMPVGSLTAHFIFNLKFQKCYFLDDGTLTLTLANYYKKHKDVSKKMFLFEGKDKYGLKYSVIEKLHAIFGHKFKKQGTLEPHFFTFFDLDASYAKSIVENKFNWFRSQVKNTTEFTKDSNIIYIVGTALVTEKIISLEYYISVLKKIQILFYPKKIIYITHRRETDAQLTTIKKETNMVLRYNEYLIEIDFFMNQIIPTHVIGTISTALFTLKKLYGTDIKIESIMLDAKQIKENKRNMYLDVVSYQNKYVDIVNSI